jgi:ABC-type protease/lipase transport system fused ATPase/permease subunit
MSATARRLDPILTRDCRFFLGYLQVFAVVHFLLFYTALINALQSVLMAIVTTRVSQKIWVETEMVRTARICSEMCAVTYDYLVF